MKMRVLVVLFILFSAFCSSTRVDSPLSYHERIGIPRAEVLLQQELENRMIKIVGGSQVDSPFAIPYQAGIVVTLTTGWTSICGGSLVSTSRVVTAAHCWFDGRSQARVLTVVLGSVTIFHGGTRLDTTQVAVHPSWNVNDIVYDIAIATIPSVVFSNSIQAIPLPSMSDVNENFTGSPAITSGYGKTSDGQNSFPATTSLHHATVTVLSNNDCQRYFDVPIHGSHLCTNGLGGKGTCNGDSGGPLTVLRNNQRILVGVVSFGLGDRCEAGSPSVYTRVTAFLSWIHAHM